MLDTTIAQILKELGDDNRFTESIADAYTELSEINWLLSDAGFDLPALSQALNDIAEINQAIADWQAENPEEDYSDALSALIRQSFFKEVA
jgi:hypothetical protein